MWANEYIINISTCMGSLVGLRNNLQIYTFAMFVYASELRGI